jgi:hypothetical protein
MDFVFDIDALTGGFNGYLNQQNYLDISKATFDAFLLTKPVPPVIVGSSADWNNYTSLLETWIAAYGTADGGVTTGYYGDYCSQKGLLQWYYLYVLQLLGITAPFVESIPPTYNRSTWVIDQWVNVQTSLSGPPINYWLGVKSSDYELVITTVEPSGVFPNI